MSHAAGGLLHTDKRTQTSNPRTIRSFVTRAGRLTAGQERALKELWPLFGVAFERAPLDLDATFGRAAPKVIEVGFGNGDHLLALAAAHPERDYLGIEVHRPGVGRLLLGIEKSALTNLRIICHDAVEVLEEQIPPACIDEILILFPDPWHKKRHHKRRLIQAPFISMLAARLKRGGCLRLATDWQPYAEQMLQVLDAETRLQNVAGDAHFMMRPERERTRFELRGERLGHAVWDLEYRCT
jgi:tRNA (guanine-N7-)-methyltransferase